MISTETTCDQTGLARSVIEATEATFGMMLECHVVRRRLSRFELDLPMHALSAVVQLTGAARGFIGLSFSRSTAQRMIQCLLGDEFHDLTTLGPSAVKEFCSTIAGKTCMLFSADLTMSRPELCKSLHSQQYAPPCLPLALEFDSDVGPFVVVFALSEVTDTELLNGRVIRGRSRRAERTEQRPICRDRRS